MAPRGLKSLLNRTHRCKLFKRGGYHRYHTINMGNDSSSGTVLRGVTKRLEHNVFSRGMLPSIARYGNERRSTWRGPQGGRKRGTAVDAQVSRLASASVDKRRGSRMLRPSKRLFDTLKSKNISIVMGKRGVCSPFHRIGTEVDLVCYDEINDALVLVELKCGHTGCKLAGAVLGTHTCNMNGPLHKAVDNTLNRHMAQLAVTHRLFVNEKDTMEKLDQMGVREVKGMLVYTTDDEVSIYDLDKWWIQKASGILDFMK